MAFSSKGKNVKTADAGVPKTLVPGNRKCKINKIELEKDKFSTKDGVYLVLHVEGEKIEGFDGFMKDLNNPSLGKHEGQVGKVKNSMFSFIDSEYNGVKKTRDEYIADFIIRIADVQGTRAALDEISEDSIEDYVREANKIVSNDIFINMAIGGKKFINAKGYESYDLFLIKPKKGKVSLESISVKPEDSALIVYNPEDKDHFRDKAKPKAVDEFNVGDELELTPEIEEPKRDDLPF